MKHRSFNIFHFPRNFTVDLKSPMASQFISIISATSATCFSMSKLQLSNSCCSYYSLKLHLFVFFGTRTALRYGLSMVSSSESCDCRPCVLSMMDMSLIVVDPPRKAEPEEALSMLEICPCEYVSGATDDVWQKSTS